MKTTAIITVRAGSRRVVNKNIRPFGDSNLLINKIRQLKRVPGIDNILVSSDSEEMLAMAQQEGCDIQHRPIEYCDEKSRTFNDMVEWVMENTDTDVVVWTPCVCPFTDENIIAEGLRAYHQYVENGDNDCVVSCRQFKEYLFDEKGPHNFSIEHHVKSQDLPDWRVIVNGFYIAKRTDMHKWRFVYGKKPYLITLSKIQALDIDDNEDFEMADVIYKKKNNLI